LQHIVQAAKRILHFTESATRDEFAQDEKTVFAVIALLQIIGEAARHVSHEFQAAHPEIEWKGAIGLRNHLSHGYFDVDLDVLWDTVSTRIPEMLHRVEPLLNQQDLGLR
jgi:uncharacterized protein with HEPN domain